jgi:excinuclease ABC subunit A
MLTHNGAAFKGVEIASLDGAQRLVEKGNTVILIEHNMHVIKVADYLIDMGPEGGSGGGKIVAEGTPEEVIKNKHSITGKYLKEYLKK